MGVVNTPAQSAPSESPSNTETLTNKENGKSLWNLFGLLKKENSTEELPSNGNGSSNATKGTKSQSPSAATEQGSPNSKLTNGTSKKPSKSPAATPEKGPNISESRPTKKMAKDPKSDRNGLQTPKQPLKSKLPASNGNGTRNTNLPPVKPKRQIPIGRSQAPKDPFSEEERSNGADTPKPTSATKSTRKLSDTQPIRLTHPVNGKDRTILPQPKVAPPETPHGPIRLQEGETALPAPEVKQPGALTRRVSDLLIDPNLKDDPFEELLDDDFDIEKLFPIVGAPAASENKK